MYGPDQLFPPGTYYSHDDGSKNSYYADVSWASAVKVLQGGVQLSDKSTNGQYKLELQWGFDGFNWETIDLIMATSDHGLKVGGTSTNFGNRARLALVVSASTGSAGESVTLDGVYASGKPF